MVKRLETLVALALAGAAYSPDSVANADAMEPTDQEITLP